MAYTSVDKVRTVFAISISLIFIFFLFVLFVE